MAKDRKGSERITKKNGSAEISVQLDWYCHLRPLTSLDKIKVETWLRQKVGDLHSEFKIEFPEMM